MASNEPVQIGFRELYDMLVKIREDGNQDRQQNAVAFAELKQRVHTLEQARGWVRNIPQQIPAWIISAAAVIAAIVIK